MQRFINGRLAIALFVIIGASLMAIFHDQIDFSAIQRWIGAKDLWGAVLFILLFAGTTVLFLPGLLFTLAGGIIFGPYVGTLLNLIGATLGAGISFLITRYLASDWIATRYSGRFMRIIEGVEKEGWKFIAFLRLVPIIPFFLLNYALGLTKINFSTYLATTFFTLIPSVAAITYLGHIGHKITQSTETLIMDVVIAIGILSSFIFIPYFTRKYYDRLYKGITNYLTKE